MITKKININSDKDLNRFYKKLFFYKTCIYRFVNFVSDNQEIKDIIKALNIKKRNMRIRYVYDRSCLYVDRFWDNKNICGFRNNKCYTQRNNSYINGCCRRCFYQSDKGCRTANLTCKMFYCSEVRKRNKVPSFNDIKILKLLSIRQRIILKHDYFSSREEVLGDLYIGFISIFLVRLLFRYLIRNII